MEFKGTPAPWFVNDNGFYFEIRDSDKLFCIGDVGASKHAYDDGDHFKNKVAYANAHLIAAAPELLESLRELVSAMERYEIDVGESAPVKHKEMMNKANSAIAKALGI
ncbi:hypothetical protein LG195_03095 [Proteus terrae]|uniref:hypothetical protein n=1 Tax=Proteus terrae TaxID=1574161 RepID=UPI00207D1D2C|nr:hypothetical protein [Proteus terrae]MCO4179221.1 hypothetical protein [Proteus terrae]MCO4188048.1 hypothetical protein [Proteus terrae]